METYCFTFAAGHHLAEYYVAIKASDREQAVVKMVIEFGYKWAHVCLEKEFNKRKYPRGCYERFLGD